MLYTETGQFDIFGSSVGEQKYFGIDKNMASLFVTKNIPSYFKNYISKTLSDFLFNHNFQRQTRLMNTGDMEFDKKRTESFLKPKG